MQATKKTKKIATILIIIILLFTTLTINAATHKYDELGRLVETTYESGRTVRYTYDNLGNITSVSVIQGDASTYTVNFNVVGENGMLAASVNDVEIIDGYSVTHGTDVVFTASPNEGYRVKEWKVNDDVIEDNRLNTFTVMRISNNMVVTVEFVNRNELDGVAVSGLVRSHNPNNNTTIQLLDRDIVKYETIIPGTPGIDQVEQSFTIENVEPGTYTLVVTKLAHTSFTIKDIVISDEDIDLTQNNRDEIKLIILTAGDINGDGLIDVRDLSILMDNFGRVVENVVGVADLNGDGQVDSRDLSLLLNGFNKSDIEISW